MMRSRGIETMRPFHPIIGKDDAARDVRMQAGLGKAVEHGRMLHSSLAGDIVFALPVSLTRLPSISASSPALTSTRRDVAARRQDNEVYLPVPVLAPDARSARRRYGRPRNRQAATAADGQNIKLAVQAGIVPEVSRAGDICAIGCACC